MKFRYSSLVGMIALLPTFSHATEFESVKSAIAQALDLKKTKEGKDEALFKKSYSVEGKSYDLYYSKDEKGEPKRFASIQTALFKPECTHTWVVGMKAKPAIEVEKVHVIEMKCVKETKVCREEGFLAQYEGKKVGDVKDLDKSVAPRATATYTSQYTTDAVKRSLSLASQFKP